MISDPTQDQEYINSKYKVVCLADSIVYNTPVCIRKGNSMWFPGIVIGFDNFFKKPLVIIIFRLYR